MYMKLGTRRGEQATVRKSSRYARGRRLGKALVGLTVLSLLAACGAGPTDSTPPPTTPPPTMCGLKVEIVGLPASVAGAVTVEGPGIPATVLTGTFEFAELEPGDYSVSIADVVNDLDEYRP